jgi:hypothetical protein
MTYRTLTPAFLALLVLVGCIEPSDRRPGTRLSGDVAAYPADWSFTDAHPEIAIEVSGIAGLPHSVTIWCAQQGGALFVGARDPESKRWPAWADASPDVRLKIGDAVYEVRLTPESDASTLERVRLAYAAKYALPTPQPGAQPEDPPSPPERYWRVGPRS